VKIIEYDCYDDSSYRQASYTKVITDAGESSFSFLDGEPEDANISRDFSDVTSIGHALVMAYEAGKSGEELEHVAKDFKSLDDYWEEV
jgi:hypothetical protein